MSEWPVVWKVSYRGGLHDRFSGRRRRFFLDGLMWGLDRAADQFSTEFGIYDLNLLF